MRNPTMHFYLHLIACCLVSLLLADDTAKSAKNVSVAWSKINLPRNHMPFFFKSNNALRKRCLKDEKCPFKEEAANTKCWGYEKDCPRPEFLPVSCPHDSHGWTANKLDQKEKFYSQGDFGYVKERLSELKTYCRAQEPGDSSLECVDHTRMCRGKNIFFDFHGFGAKGSNDRYRENTIGRGHVGGKCQFDVANFHRQGTHKSPLQSWYSELENFESFTEQPQCDITIKEPVIVIKLDAGVNMYHHFCDFINLYVTQHANNQFLQNVRIVIWDTSMNNYWSYFGDMWKVFSSKKPLMVKDWENKRVCFKDIVFSFLARMRYGLFYNMPLIGGCQGTGLFRAFSEHSLHRFNIKQEGPLKDKIRITLLDRQTKFRNILNQKTLVDTLLKKLGNEVELKIVTYDLKTSFTEQVRQTHNSDVFISMHGAGLTHLLFLPHWGAVFEIYNCDDKDCYLDLARLRGVNYYTWEKADKVTPQDEGKHPTLGTPHKKFTNYSFDPAEFVRMVKKIVKDVKKHPDYVAAYQAKFGGGTPEKVEL